MAEETKPGAVGFESSIPILNVRNVPASIEHYCKTLGFKEEWAWTDEGHKAPNFACVSRGHVEVFLCQGGQGSPGTWVYLNLHTLGDLAALHSEYESSGAKIVGVTGEQPWGSREMLVEDLDSHTLRIGAPTDHEH